MIQTQDLCLEGTADHEWTRDSPPPRSSVPAPWPLTGPRGQLGATKRAVLERWTDFAQLLGLAGTRIDGLAPDYGTRRHDALDHRDRESLMRHYLWVLPLSLTPTALPGGVPPRTAAAPLIPRLSSSLRLTAADLCALAGAV